MGTQRKKIPSSPGQRRILLAVVADEVEDREALSSAFAGGTQHRIMTSCTLEQATDAIDGRPLDAIIGFVDSEDSWRRFRSLAERFPEHLSVLLVTDPDDMGAAADGQVLNAVVGLERHRLAGDAAGIAARAAREFGVLGTQVAKAEPLDRERLASLTDREREILVLTADGRSIKEIARRINRTYATVATHRQNMMEKLRLHDKVSLTRFAIRVGLIEA